MLASVGAAFAADRRYSPTPAYNWSGLWVGAEAGYVSGTATSTGVTPSTLSGADFALHAIYNYQTASNWVISPFVVVPLPTASSTIASTPVKINWALVGGLRVGYAMDRWLPYALVGAVVGGGTVRTYSATHTGYTFGLGVDYAVTDQWTVGARYAYVSMGAETYGGAGPFGWNGNSVVATLNYKLY